MTTINDLEVLAKELTECLPPPLTLTGLENVIPGSGRWVVVRTGAGTYAIRAHFDTASGKPIVAKTNGEIRGYASTVETAMRFAIGVATAGRHYWYAV